jgi:hypothetical protein
VYHDQVVAADLEVIQEEDLLEEEMEQIVTEEMEVQTEVAAVVALNLAAVETAVLV